MWATMSEKEDGHQANVKTHSGEKPTRQMYSDGEKKTRKKHKETRWKVVSAKISENEGAPEKYILY